MDSKIKKGKEHSWQHFLIFDCPKKDQPSKKILFATSQDVEAAEFAKSDFSSKNLKWRTGQTFSRMLIIPILPIPSSRQLPKVTDPGFEAKPAAQLPAFHSQWKSSKKAKFRSLKTACELFLAVTNSVPKVG